MPLGSLLQSLLPPDQLQQAVARQQSQGSPWAQAAQIAGVMPQVGQPQRDQSYFDPSRPATPSTGPSPYQPGPGTQMGGTTRRGSQILDAQGNVIGHYDDNNQPVYHGGASPWGGSQPGPGNGGINPGPYGPIGRGGGGPVANYPEAGRDIYHAYPPGAGSGIGIPNPFAPPGGVVPQPPPSYGGAGSGIGIPNPWPAPSQPMGVPGSMQQSLYGSGLLRPAMPSMNNQSGY